MCQNITPPVPPSLRAAGYPFQGHASGARGNVSCSAPSRLPPQMEIEISSPAHPSIKDFIIDIYVTATSVVRGDKSASVLLRDRRGVVHCQL